MKSIDTLFGDFDNPLVVDDYKDMLNLEEGIFVKINNVVGMVSGPKEYRKFNHKVSLVYDDKTHVFVLDYSLKYFPEPIVIKSYLKKSEIPDVYFALRYMVDYK